MHALDGGKGYLVHQDIKSDIHIRRYGVSGENIETIAVPSLEPVDRNIIILDEIGKMECFSEAFKVAVQRALDAPNIVVGTITFSGDDFIQGIKKRDDIEIYEVTLDNRDELPEIILKKVENILGGQVSYEGVSNNISSRDGQLYLPAQLDLNRRNP